MSGRTPVPPFEYHNVRSLALYGPRGSTATAPSGATQAKGGSASAEDVKGTPLKTSISQSTTGGHPTASRGHSASKAVPNDVEERDTTTDKVAEKGSSAAKVAAGQEDEQPSKTLEKKVAETGVNGPRVLFIYVCFIERLGSTSPRLADLSQESRAHADGKFLLSPRLYGSWSPLPGPRLWSAGLPPFCVFKVQRRILV